MSSPDETGVGTLDAPRDPSWSRALADVFVQFRDEARSFVNPRTAEHERLGTFDRASFERLGAMGLFAFGDGRLDALFAGLEGLATGADDAGFCVSIVAHAAVVIPVLAELGTAEARAAFLPELVSGHALGAVANAEPRSGTDVLGIRSRVRRNEAGFLLSARKRSITNVGEAGVMLVSARAKSDHGSGTSPAGSTLSGTSPAGSTLSGTSPAGSTPKRDLLAFAVTGRASGCYQQRGPDRMGLRTSPTGNLLARNVALPPWCLLGDGVAFFRRCFALERLAVGALYVAALRRAQRRALACITGRPALAAHQYVQERVVRIRTSLACMEALLFRTRALFLANMPCEAELSVLKGEGAERALVAAQDVVRLMGARGYEKAAGAEKDVRDLIGLTMLGGTTELHKNVVFGAAQRGT